MKPDSAIPSAPAESEHEVGDFVCTACGCTCDDLRLVVRAGRIAEVSPPCPLAVRFLQEPFEPPPHAALVDGRPAEREAAIDAAAELLRSASAPLVMGLERATVEAQRWAVDVADRLGAAIDPTGDRGESRSYAAVQTIGAVTATLGEVAARSDLIVYWNVDPAVTHPRHMERFARRSANGPTDRKPPRVITVAPARPATSAASDEYLSLSPHGSATALTVIRALVQGREVDARQLATQTGAPLEQWGYLAQRLKMSRYATIFYEPAAGAADEADAESLALTELVIELHRHTRAAALRLGAPWNAAGATQVLLWQTGFPTAVSLAAGYPRHQPGEAAALRLLERGEVDALLVIAADPLPHLTGAAKTNFESLPRVVIDDRATASATSARVALFTARFGIETAGSVFRSDGVALPLRPALPAQLPSAETVLRELSQQLSR